MKSDDQIGEFLSTHQFEVFKTIRKRYRKFHLFGNEWSEEIANDIQSTFLIFFQLTKEEKLLGDLSIALTSIALNVASNRCRNHWVRLKRKADENYADNIPDERSGEFESEYELKDSLRAILTEMEFAILEKRAQGYRHQEIAKSLGLNDASTVSKQLCEIRKKVAGGLF